MRANQWFAVDILWMCHAGIGSAKSFFGEANNEAIERNHVKTNHSKEPYIVGRVYSRLTMRHAQAFAEVRRILIRPFF